MRDFRFGLQITQPTDRAALIDEARRAEDLGFATILVADHAVDGLLSPLTALATMAEATTGIRVDTLVLNKDFRHPALLAREAATLDLLCDGRLELGLVVTTSCASTGSFRCAARRCLSAATATDSSS